MHTEPAIVHQFLDLATPPTSAYLASVHARGWLPLLTLEPTTLPDPLHAIIAGTADRELAAWSKAVASSAAPVMIDPLPEMDLAANTWGIGDHIDSTGKRYTNTAADIVAAFIAIHDRIVAQAGQEKVLWVFNPQGTPLGQGTGRDWESFYPGDAYVSWVALDVYNVSVAATPPRPWQSLASLLEAGAGASDPGLYARMSLLAPHKPMMLASFGTVEAGGDKAQWLHDAARDIANAKLFPAIDAAVYFDGDIGPIDLHLATSPDALAAARSGFGVTSPYCLTGGQVVALTNTGE